MRHAVRGVAAVATTAAALAMIAGARPTASPAPSARLVRVEGSAPQMGTLARIVAYAPTHEAGGAALTLAFARIAEIDRRLSDYRDDSEVAALSRAPAGVPVPVSDDLFAVLAASESVARRTHGAFDVTAGRLTHLWRRARRLNAWPPAGQVDAARAAGGYAQLRLDPATRTATPVVAGLEIDAGGIAKGYAADEAVRVLRDRGLRASLVVIGGDVATGDAPPGEPGWTVAIPRLGDGAPGEPFRLTLANGAVSTSGDAEQWMTVDGVRRSHVIDLRTGWPVTGRSSTTVVAARGIDTDALSTTLNVLGAADGEALLATVAGPGGAPAQALWQRIAGDGGISIQHTPRWPAPPAASVPTPRGPS